METVKVGLSTEILEPVTLDPEVLDRAMKAIAAVIDEEHRRVTEWFLMSLGPLKPNSCDCRGLLHSCGLFV